MTANDSKKSNQRFFSHEVVQTSAMDCGPAALKSILEGFGIPVSYGRLREACQTDVDGTSIDTIEDIALQLGLEAEQIMLPVDHLFLQEAEALPAIVVVRLPNGLTHFVVVWNKFGKFIQVMDPSTGRRWPTLERFLNEVYTHSYEVDAGDWRDWAGTEGFLAPLRRRLSDLEINEKRIDALISSAVMDQSWKSLGTLDAATRMVTEIVRSKGIQPGQEAGRIINHFYEKNLGDHYPEIEEEILEEPESTSNNKNIQIPSVYWSVIPAQSQTDEINFNSAKGRLILRGAVLIRILGTHDEKEIISEDALSGGIPKPLPPDLEAALKEPVYKPEREIWKQLRKDGLLTPAILLVAVLMATFAVLLEAFLLQGVVQIGEGLGIVSQRIWAAITLMLFIITPLILEYPINSALWRMGRRLETRLRILLLEKIPKLGDKYFRSRLTSDMTQRAHDLRQLRSLPNLAFNLLRTGFQLLLTMIGVIWLDPISAPLAIAGTVFFMVLSFLSRPVLEEQDRRLRTQIGALSRFYLDALLGLVPIKTHAAERAFRREHETHMFEWVRSGRDYFNLSITFQSVGTILYTLFSVGIIVNYIAKGGQSSEILLLFYWTLSLPTLGQSLVLQIQQYPMHRNRVLRLLEPLAAPDEEDSWFTDKTFEIKNDQNTLPHEKPASVSMEHVWVYAGGNVILKDINLLVNEGEHIAIVGPSGAGKSSLVGLLLGWHRPGKGIIKVDGEILNGERIQSLRRETTWVDPAVQLWNRSLYENIRYGMEDLDGTTIGKVLQSADLYGVIDLLPEGMKTNLGEGGGLVSGGEGQRVRLGRALYRQGIRLAILDEPFRGLDRKQRSQLLSRAQEHWKNATMIFISHDISETSNFDRVLVIEDGQIMEDGQPQVLSQDKNSHYSLLVESDKEVRQSFWEKPVWRKMVLEGGILKSRNKNK